MRTVLILVLAAACGGHPAAPAAPTTAAAGGCPPAVTAAVTKAHPDATQHGCKAEHEDGKDIFEVKLTLATGGAAELDVAPDGTILATEEVVTAMPDPVAKAFAAKYPGAQPTRIERVTMPGKPAVFEIKTAGKEATFSETGAFVEEEGPDGDGDKNDGEKDGD